MVKQEIFQRLLSELSETGTELVAVSKLKPLSDLQQLYQYGQRDFGENYVQELAEKAAQWPEPSVRWHFIGHLQTNKVKYIAPFVYMIQSVDSFRLLREINKQAAKNNRTIACLLQIHIAREETKFGMDEKELVEFMDFYEAQRETLQHVQLCGLMGMASFTGDEAQLRTEFRQLKSLFEFTRRSYFIGHTHFRILSMGMSGDYQLAIAEGSNMVRVGSLLFGSR